MQRFLITNTDKFTGQAELVFNDKGTLCIIDCSDTDMDTDTIRHFKNVAPVTVTDLPAAFKTPTIIVEAGFDITFDRFYKDYPIKRNRYKAEKAWAKLNDTDRIKAWHSISSYKKYLSKKNWLSAMLADSYLNRKEFETEWSKIKD
jgi:hypothetical protein